MQTIRSCFFDSNTNCLHKWKSSYESDKDLLNILYFCVIILVESQCCPPISLFQWIIEHDTILIEQHENYQKRSYRNRFYINGPQGKLLFSIPLCKGKNEQQNIKAVEISYHDSWDIQLSKIVQTNYGSAPYFDFYYDSLLSIFTKRPQYLFDLNTQLLKWFLKSTQLDKNIEFTQTPIEALQVSPQHYDVVLGLSILHLLPDPITTLKTVFTVLKPGGVFISSTVCIDETQPWLKYLLPLLRLTGKVPFVQPFKINQLVSKMTDAGFVIEHQWLPGKGKAVFLVARKPH